MKKKNDFCWLDSSARRCPPFFHLVLFFLIKNCVYVSGFHFRRDERADEIVEIE